MKPALGGYRRGHARAWSGTKVRRRKPAGAHRPGPTRQDDAKTWKRRAVTRRARSDRPKRPGLAR
jgi:hypothetical protein